MNSIISFSLNYTDDYALFSFYLDEKPVHEIQCGISLRCAGNMGFSETPVTPQRLALLKKLKIDPARLFSCNQSHSRNVMCVENSIDSVVDADGLVGIKDNVLSVTVADCLPIYLFDNKTKSFAICHSGWKGTGIALEALRLMHTKYSAEPKNISVTLGPCILGSNYKVNTERAALYHEEFGKNAGAWPLGPAVRKETSEYGKTEYFIDMQAANANLLFENGVKNIAVCKNCTLTDERLGSFRREGRAFTKMLAFTGYSISGFLPASFSS